MHSDLTHGSWLEKWFKKKWRWEERGVRGIILKMVEKLEGKVETGKENFAGFPLTYYIYYYKVLKNRICCNTCA